MARCGYIWSLNTACPAEPASLLTVQAQKVELTVFSAAKRAMVTTYDMEEHILNRIPVYSSRVVVIPNYLETVRFNPASNSKKANKVIFV